MFSGRYSRQRRLLNACRIGFIDGLSSGADGRVNNVLVFCPMGDHAPAELCGFEYSSSVYTRESVGRSRLNGGMAKSRGRKISHKKSRKIISQITHFRCPLLLSKIVS
jgi:hypothetical protein